MPGKYSHLKGSMTKFSQEPDYQTKVRAKRDEIKKNLQDEDYPVNVKTMGVVYKNARNEKDRLEDLIKAQNLIIEAMNQELVELLEASDFTQVKLGSGVSLNIKDDVYVTVKNRQEFLAWIDEEELTDLLTVNYKTMESLVKNRIIDGQEVPPGIDTYFKQSIQMRGGKNDSEEG